MRPVLYFVAALFLFAESFHGAAAQSPQFVPAYPLYCQGPLTTGPRLAARPPRLSNGRP